MTIKATLQKYALKALGLASKIDKGLFFGAFGGFFSWLGWKGITYYNNKIVYSGLNLLVKKLTEPEILINRVRPNKQSKIAKY